MTLTITKSKLAIAILAVALLVPATALATHVFSDVPDDKFYAEPVKWAADNAITTGKSPTSFAPDDPVTRGESVTFLKRYDDNIVQPALATLTSDVASNAADIADNAADIATNAADIADNAADIATNAADISDLQGTVAPLVNSVAATAGGDQSFNLSTTDAIARSVSLMPPADGTVIVTSSGYFANDDGANDVSLRCSITTGTAIDFSFLQLANLPPAAPESFQALAGVRGFEVTEGVLLTVNLVCDESGTTGTGNGRVNDTQLTAIFAPS